ncbi:hypothetical protein GCM10010293_50430 [Streptomyces griseoflavus]|nr:hypothetical protein GCM10010293_50430 [Streptomyces griseoflavus]
MPEHRLPLLGQGPESRRDQAALHRTHHVVLTRWGLVPVVRRSLQPLVELGCEVDPPGPVSPLGRGVPDHGRQVRAPSVGGTFRRHRAGDGRRLRLVAASGR